MKQANLPTFFAGAMTPDGYLSHLGEVYDPADGWVAYLVKGGAGMGKSTLMKRVLAALTAQGEPAWRIPCPSDPDSLDGVVFPRRRVCLLDATAPHIVDPRCPVACEVLVDTGAACDPAAARENREAILAVDGRLKGQYQRVGRYLAAITALRRDTFRAAMEVCDRERAVRFAVRLADRLIPDAGGRGKETVGFLSALTPKGHLTFPETVSAWCDRVFAVEDENGAVSRTIMATLRLAALEAGQEVFTGMCPLDPEEKIDHVLLPGLRLGFVTCSRALDFPATERVIHARRFEDVAALHGKRQRLAFNRRAVSDLIDGACQTLARAKSLHDELEALYAPGMDFSALDGMAESLIAEIRG